MESFIKSDIFFFVTTVVVAIIGAAGVVALYYLVRILQDIKGISRVVKAESEELASDISTLRTSVKAKGFMYVGSFLRGFFKKKKKGRNPDK